MVLEINKKVPDFKSIALVDGEEKEISLSDFLGKKVAIYFYPKDMTPGCTTQACNLRDNFERLKEKDITVLGVSVDSIKSHKNFAEKKELPFILISDEDKKIVEMFGVWDKKSMYGRFFFGTLRKTFLIDEKGILRYVIEKPKVSGHAEEIMEEFENIK